MERKLETWKARYLSSKGKVTIIKATPSNLSINLMSIFKCPVEVSKHIGMPGLLKQKRNKLNGMQAKE